MDAEHEPEIDSSEAISMHRADSQQARVNRLERLRSSGESSVMGSVVHKVCCQCGVELNRRPRFRDSHGRYWCPVCNEKDQQKAMPTPCDDCRIDMPRNTLVEYRGRLLCPVCVEKHRFDEKVTLEVRGHPELSKTASPPIRQKMPLLPLAFAIVAVAICLGVVAYLLWQ